MPPKKGKEESLNYSAELRLLKESGPKRLYLLWGPEDYLRAQFITQLKKICFGGGDDSFSFKRFVGPQLDSASLQQAIDAVPFMSEYSLIQIEDADINHQEQADAIIELIKDIPDYCVVVFSQNSQYEPDGRMKLVREIRKQGYELKFNQQGQGMMIDWVSRRFAAAGKKIELEAAQRLIFVSGGYMNMLIPEIEKIASYAKGESVTVSDVDAVANHIPEAAIFDMTDYISQKKYNSAFSVFGELMADKNNKPIPTLALIGRQMRQLYAARLVYEDKLDIGSFMTSFNVKNDYIAKKMVSSAKGFTLSQLIYAVELCADADYSLKTGGSESWDSVQELMLKIAMSDNNA